MTHPNFPFDEVAANAQKKVKEGWFIYQKWTCQHCGARQTMPVANHFYEKGRCEECKKITDIRAGGCNFLATSHDVAEFMS